MHNAADEDDPRYEWSLTAGVHTLQIGFREDGTKLDSFAFKTDDVPPDAVPPVITLAGDDPLELTLGETYVEPGATAFDDIDGDITANIVIDASAVNTAVADSYTVTYDVADLAGNSAAQVTRTVNVSSPDVDAPVVSVVSPGEGEVVGAGVVEVSGSVVDESALVWTYMVLNNTVTGEYWNGSAWQSSWAWFLVPVDGGGLFASSVDLGAGEFRVRVYSRDAVGLTGDSGNVSFVVSSPDVDAPVVSVVSPGGG